MKKLALSMMVVLVGGGSDGMVAPLTDASTDRPASRAR
jgi:hypothetical protein